MIKHFYSNGKLLLTGEYAVLDGALSLALPTTYGQSLTVSHIHTPQLLWRSVDQSGETWFKTTYKPAQIFSGEKLPERDTVEQFLIKLLGEAKKLNPDFLTDSPGYIVETKLTFPKNWGLGSSSTLINNIAQWAGVDAYTLLWNAFIGSGYDIACAQSNQPILYRLVSMKPVVRLIDYAPPFKDHLYFVYLDKKQNSREGIANYKKVQLSNPTLIDNISKITENILSCVEMSSFESLLQEHEQLISEVLQTPTVHETLFPDYKGTLKSLGAWGGDFMLATGNSETRNYFEKKGYRTVIPYGKMVL